MTKLIVVATLLAAVAMAPSLILHSCARQTTHIAPARSGDVCQPGTSC